jgi:hypothetical protein
MPRPNPPRKRPRRRPDAVERSARAEVSLARQTAQVKEKNGSDAKQGSSPKQQPAAKARPAAKGAASARTRRIDEPFVPWARRSYLILVALLAAAEILVGSLAYFTIQNPKPVFGQYVLLAALNPLVPVAAALVAAPLAKYITKESRSLRLMESVMLGITQLFIWLALFVVLTYVLNAVTPAQSTAAEVATAIGIAGLLVVELLSFVATFYLYPPLYKFMRRRPPPRTAPARKPKPEEAKPTSEATAKDATP